MCNDTILPEFSAGVIMYRCGSIFLYSHSNLIIALMCHLLKSYICPLLLGLSLSLFFWPNSTKASLHFSSLLIFSKTPIWLSSTLISTFLALAPPWYYVLAASSSSSNHFPCTPTVPLLPLMSSNSPPDLFLILLAQFIMIPRYLNFHIPTPTFTFHFQALQCFSPTLILCIQHFYATYILICIYISIFIHVKPIYVRICIQINNCCKITSHFNWLFYYAFHGDHETLKSSTLLH